MHFEARRWSSLRNQSMTFNRETRITQVREFTRLRLIRLFRTHDCEETHTAPRAFIEFSINTVHELNSFRISSVRMSCARERQKKKGIREVERGETNCPDNFTVHRSQATVNFKFENQWNAFNRAYH